jgi:nucleotide-binding universal stress UspA family protein
MTRYPAVICPVDFSDASRAALGHAAAIADHFGAEITVLAVVDPFIAALASSEPTSTTLEIETKEALQRYCEESLAALPKGPRSLKLRYAIGTPALEILREAHEATAELIVMSSHGRRGLQKMFFGSTTERVLRHTDVPVLIIPPSRTLARPLSQLAGEIGEVVAPVDLTTASTRQVTVAAAIASALSVPLMLTHVLAPVGAAVGSRWVAPDLDSVRIKSTQEQLAEIQSSIASTVRTESLVVSGEPSEEIIKVADSRGAKLIVMGLHSSGVLGPRMGSVTYRVLCTTEAFVLALPPRAPGRVTRRGQQSPADDALRRPTSVRSHGTTALPPRTTPV